MGLIYTWVKPKKDNVVLFWANWLPLINSETEDSSKKFLSLKDYIIKLALDILKNENDKIVAISGWPWSWKWNLVKNIKLLFVKLAKNDKALMLEIISYLKEDITEDDLIKFLSLLYKFWENEKPLREFLSSSSLSVDDKKLNDRWIPIINWSYYSEIFSRNIGLIETDWFMEFIWAIRRSSEEDWLLFDRENFIYKYSSLEYCSQLVEKWLSTEEEFLYQYVYSKNNIERAEWKWMTSIKYKKKKIDLNILLVIDWVISFLVANNIINKEKYSIDKVMFYQNIVYSMVRIIERDIMFNENKTLIWELAFRLLENSLLEKAFLEPSLEQADFIIKNPEVNLHSNHNDLLAYLKENDIFESLYEAQKIAISCLNKIWNSWKVPEEEVKYRINYVKNQVNFLINSFLRLLD